MSIPNLAEIVVSEDALSAVPQLEIVNSVHSFCTQEDELPKTFWTFRIPGMAFNQRNFPALKMHIGNVSILNFVPTHTNMAGCEDVQTAEVVAARFAELLTDTGHMAGVHNLTGSTQVASVKAGFHINLSEIARTFGAYATYDRDKFPGLFFRFLQERVTLTIFWGGAVNVTGVRDFQFARKIWWWTYHNVLVPNRIASGTNLRTDSATYERNLQNNALRTACASAWTRHAQTTSAGAAAAERAGCTPATQSTTPHTRLLRTPAFTPVTPRYGGSDGAAPEFDVAGQRVKAMEELEGHAPACGWLQHLDRAAALRAVRAAPTAVVEQHVQTGCFPERLMQCADAVSAAARQLECQLMKKAFEPTERECNALKYVELPTYEEVSLWPVKYRLELQRDLVLNGATI